MTDWNDITALELKVGGKGVISWTSRGQLGLECGMTATTVLKRYKTSEVERQNIISQFKEILKTKDKQVEFIYKSLRGAKDIYDKGDHVSTVLKDQTFRLHHDNRREF